MLMWSREFMNVNPFQIPSCFQMDRERRRRERFKKAVIAIVAGFVMLLVGLLIEGCMSEHSKTAAATSPAPVPQADSTPSAPQNTAPILQLAMASAPQPVPTATRQMAAADSEAIYVVKSGDTLTRIAKTHGTTVKSLKSVNELADDHIVIGTKLKIPAA
jgi:LysM repeat protein